MKLIPAVVLTAAVGLAGLTPALAHHSGSMFDMTREVVIEGTIKDFQWTNPHSWLLIEAPGPDGMPAVWSFEAGPPSILSGLGVKRSQFVPGEKVAVHAFPIKDNSAAGLLQRVVRADGSSIILNGFDKAAAADAKP